MKLILITLTSLALLSVSCKKETKKEEPVETETTEAKEAAVTYQVSDKGSEIYWTGYKFTNKTAVKGKFKTIEVTNAPVANSPVEAFNGVAFSIPTSSIFSDNEERDGKLKTLFFDIMDTTELITGTFSTKGEEIFVNLKLNNVMKTVPLTSKISDRHVKLNGTINILDFGAEKAFNSIHKACELLHTGEDGVSKTWEEFGIEAIVYLK